jgi:hypothetical protein
LAAEAKFTITSFLHRELTAYPGRYPAAGRIVLACLITMIAVQVLQIPNGFLACFYALNLPRDGADGTLRNGLTVIAANLAGTAVAVIGMSLFIDHPVIHVFYLAGIFFLAFFLVRTAVNYSVALGFIVISVAASSVNIIWATPGLPQPAVATALGTGFGIILASTAVIAVEWLTASDSHATQASRHARRIFVADALTNPGQIEYAARGCAAAALVYVIWSVLDWPGLGVCTVTCVLAAPLSSAAWAHRVWIGRLGAWALAGALGLGSQIFILPHFDSLAGFALPFAAGSWIAAWLATSRGEMGYFGRQMALPFYITLFETFAVNPSLIASRDRLCGILLGLLTMWVVFGYLRSAQLEIIADARD